MSSVKQDNHYSDPTRLAKMVLRFNGLSRFNNDEIRDETRDEDC